MAMDTALSEVKRAAGDALPPDSHTSTSPDIEAGHVVDNAGNLEKNFSLISLAGIGLVTGNVWPALGGSLLASISNGGAPGVLYEFIAASFCYFCVAAVIAEMASALPSSSAVLLWSSVLGGPRHGRMLGYFAGWWNTLAWIFGEASMSSISASICIQIYAVLHPDYVAKPWHSFICYLLITWLACAIVCLANRSIPAINIAGLVLIVSGAIITVVVCLSMVGKRSDFASTNTVWADWQADIGYPSGFVFVAGMLNGAFAMGTPDITSHLAEEIPHPEINVPKATALQFALGFITGFVYLVAILYSINDYAALADVYFPIAAVYRQATGSASGTAGLLVVILLPVLVCTVGVYVTCGRTLWTLARIGATPFADKVGHVSSTQHVPLYSTLACATFVTILGCIQLGSSTAFNAFVNSFVLHSSSSYMAASIPYLLHRNNPGFKRGPFFMRGVLGWLVHGWACGYMLVWFVIYSFPSFLPTDADTMNYSSLIWGGLTLLQVAWWFLKARHKCTMPKRIGEE